MYKDFPFSPHKCLVQWSLTLEVQVTFQLTYNNGSFVLRKKDSVGAFKETLLALLLSFYFYSSLDVKQE